MSHEREPASGPGDETSLQSTLLPGAREPSGGVSMQDTADAQRPVTAAPLTASRVDRFALLRRIGAGAMGVVWIGYDEVLDRRVAIKLMRADRVIAATDRERMLREARAMARLSHPNVVQVYDAGDDHGRVFVAMELVTGRSLRQWLAEPAARGWPAVVAMFRAIAAGLAAAHACGVVHRDFKPENVMIGDDGVPKVADFGLAEVGGRSDVVTLDSDVSILRAVELTATGAFIGTPAYMAPEQHRCEPTDAASDQFAFCIALWEALHGERPFRGENTPGLAIAVCEGRRLPPARVIPGWLQRVLERGLEIDPARRWPSMTALGAELDRERTRWRAGVGGAAAIVVVAGALAWANRAPAPCVDAGEPLASEWATSGRAALEHGFAAIDSSFARETWTRIAPSLDDWTQRWIDGRIDACAATELRREQSPAVMDLRMACLARARQSLDAATELLASPDADTLAHADEIVASLAELDRCADVDALLAEVPPPPEREREAVAAARAALAQLVAQRASGRDDQAHAALATAEARLEGIAYPPVHTELLFERARLADDRNDELAAEATTRQALEAALRSDQRELARRSALLLMTIVGHGLDRPAQAMVLVEVARGLSDGAPAQQAELLAAIGAVQLAAGTYPAAVEAFTAALALRESDPEVGLRERIDARLDLATAIGKSGRGEQARQAYADALGLLEREYGPRHPQVARARQNLAQWLIVQGQPQQAEAELRLALSIFADTLGADAQVTVAARGLLAVALLRSLRPHDAELELRAVIDTYQRTLGPDHAKVGLERGTLALALQEQGRLEEAVEQVDLAVAISSKALGPRHPDVIGMRNNYGSLLHALGRDAESLAEHRACAEGRLAVLGPDHPDTATSHFNIAVVSLALGRAADAEAETAIALPVFRARLGDDHRLVYATLSLRGMALHDLGRLDEAAAALESAWRGQDREGVAPRKAADTAAELAAVLWDSGGDRARARMLAERALALYASAGEAGASGHANVTSWLRAH
jgi:eukaryotic-like serine/threonine-protein kinase